MSRNPLPAGERQRLASASQGEGTRRANPSPDLAFGSATLSPGGRGVDDWAWPALAFLLCLLALAHPIDHDESQYVAAAVLTAHGLLPYRDYAYLQTPLQPFLFAPVAWAAGTVTWPALRMANALLGALAIRCVHGAAREVASRQAALAATALFGCTDILLFSIGTARNDALPAACLAAALWLAVRAEKREATRRAALAVGLLLASAAATKISYALPAAAYGLWALARPRHRPFPMALGALPVALLIGWTYLLSPKGFIFGVWTFPTKAPLDWYADRPWKLSLAAKLLDTLKFLALGPALLAIAQSLFRRRLPAMLLLLTLAGLIAALLPTPTWRQYLLPMLPPLYVMLAHRWALQPPGKTVRIAAVTFATAGLAPTLFEVASGQPAMVEAMRDGAAIRQVLHQHHVPPGAPVAALSPQFLPATAFTPDPAFATGPFVFRTRGLIPRELAAIRGCGNPPRVSDYLTAGNAECLSSFAVLIGGEASWTGGDPRLDAALERQARAYRFRRIGVPGTPFRVYIRPPIVHDEPSGPA